MSRLGDWHATALKVYRDTPEGPRLVPAVAAWRARDRQIRQVVTELEEPERYAKWLSQASDAGLPHKK